MYIKKISLINFKNYAETDIGFSPQINVLTGVNGSGKTNLLDAIHCLSLTRSAFSSTEANSVRHNEAFFSIRGHFSKNNAEFTVQYDLTGPKKTFQLNKTPYSKLSEHIGAFPVVLITPYDTDVIREGSEERRKFVDAIISQIDSLYLSDLIRYNTALKQRNSLLKEIAERNKVDKDLIESYNLILLKSGLSVFQKRKAFLDQFIPLFIGHYLTISGEKEAPTLKYESHCHDEDFEKKFYANFDKDVLLQRTGKGIHKDDYGFYFDEYPVKSFGSQGQQKSFVIALKLAQFDIINQHRGIKPILLLDDIFDKLDDERITRLMEMVANEKFGQLFITDARPERTEKFLKDIRSEIRIFQVEAGEVVVQSSI